MAGNSLTEVSASTDTTSVICVDMGKPIDFSSQSFEMGLFVPVFFFFLGMGISAIYKVIRGI